MRLRPWTHPSLDRRSFGLIIGCAVAGGWAAGIVFWALLSPRLLDLAEAGWRHLHAFTGELQGATRGGTGFVVSPAGHVLTNEHVVEDCESITARIDGTERPLTLIATDYANDLAALKLDKPAAHASSFRDSDSRLAEPVIVPGYPLPSVLSSTMHVTTGLVSNLAAMHDNTSSFQITAPTQPGNSGSPVLDQAGNVLGVLAGGLDAEEMRQETGTIPELVNFVIKSSVIRSFLESNSVEFRLATSSDKRETEEIAAEARLYTLPLICRE